LFVGQGAASNGQFSNGPIGVQDFSNSLDLGVLKRLLIGGSDFLPLGWPGR
jgi:hypothetical protein